MCQIIGGYIIVSFNFNKTKIPKGKNKGSNHGLLRLTAFIDYIIDHDRVLKNEISF